MINVRPGTGITGQPIYHQRYNFGYMKDHMRELKDVKDIHDRNSVQRDLSIRKKVKGVKKRSQVELLRK